MALTLPYPNLDFVPLDVLTAEEMNEIVANYTYIANQFPIASANIATAGVTSSNIDWSTIQPSSTEKIVGTWIDGSPIYEKSYSGTVSVTSGTLKVEVIETGGIKAVLDASGYVAWTAANSAPLGQMTYMAGTNYTYTCVVKNNDNIELRLYTSTGSYSDRPYEAAVRYLKLS